MERPALQRLLADIALGNVDVVVVYKIDRLTRSLADFARMVELFDRHKVSFVVSGPGCCCYLPQLKLSFSVTGG